ncbi:hypothetical protein E2C01_080030 [Portunus trituberculatus]|uniref:Uncharacterized protein n=1 Tax=Portunus trituberculatus TaxID=210409 RepID=A0A5B7IS29_PORTR|nr:hypothetical protein [Portunus trituberculatus]
MQAPEVMRPTSERQCDATLTETHNPTRNGLAITIFRAVDYSLFCNHLNASTTHRNLSVASKNVSRAKVRLGVRGGGVAVVIWPEY